MAFRHLSANSVDETLAAMKEHGEDGKVFAGGVALSILMKSRVYEPEVLIDIAGAGDLDFIEGTGNGGVCIGAKTVHRKIETSPLVQERFRCSGKFFIMWPRFASVTRGRWAAICALRNRPPTLRARFWPLRPG